MPVSQTIKIGSALLAVSIGVLAGCSGVGPVAGIANSSVAGLGAGAGKLNSVAIEASQYGDAAYVPGEVVVKFKDTTRANPSRFGLTQKKMVAGINVSVLTITTEATVEATIKKLQADPNVVYAEPNYIARISDAAEPNDPDFSKQYAPQITKAVEGWAIHSGKSDAVLAIVDTGIDANHPDLAGKVLPGWDMVDNDNDPKDGHGHGTHCAGIAAALTNNKVGIAGIAPDSKIFSVRVLDNNGSGTYANVAGGMIKAADLGAKVLSMSLGGPSSSKEIEDAVKYCQSKDVLVIAAMGNDGKVTQSYPAAIPGVLAVGSTDSADKRSSFSNMGKHISISAPGSKIWSTLPTYGSAMGKGYGFASGTSMATPAAAGLAILVRSQNPSFDAKATRARIEATADDIGPKGFDQEYGFGRINVLKALSATRR
jgi:thermitase